MNGILENDIWNNDAFWIFLIGCFVFFLIFSFANKMGKKQMETQKYQDYSASIHNPVIPQQALHSDKKHVLAEWTSEGVLIKQLNQETQSLKEQLQMLKELKDGTSIDKYFHDVFISYQEIVSIRRIVKGERNRRYFTNVIQIRGENEVIQISTTTLNPEQLSELINTCLYFNRSIEIDQVTMKVFLNKRLPNLSQSRKMARLSKKL